MKLKMKIAALVLALMLVLCCGTAMAEDAAGQTVDNTTTDGEGEITLSYELGESWSLTFPTELNITRSTSDMLAVTANYIHLAQGSYLKVSVTGTEIELDDGNNGKFNMTLSDAAIEGNVGVISDKKVASASLIKSNALCKYLDQGGCAFAYAGSYTGTINLTIAATTAAE